jgi:carbonic anhydrase
VDAAFHGGLHGPIDRWLQRIRDIRVAHAAELDRLADHVGRWRRLCELNVTEQVIQVSRIPAVREAWLRKQPLAIHGWIYDLRDGLLRDLKVGISHLDAPER